MQRFRAAAEPHVQSHEVIIFYHFAEDQSSALELNAYVVTDPASPFYVMGPALRLGPDHRFLSSGSLGSMGFALPAANGPVATGH
jgi:acetolactate synthase-1/2/3 large subunit